MILKKIFLLILLGSLISVQAQPIKDQLSKKWQALVADPSYRHASMSLLVRNISTGETVFAKNEQLGLAPASTQKIITAATAYELLGAKYVYRTNVSYRGVLNNGVLDGDIIVLGSGDPTLGSWRYEKTKETQIINDLVRKLAQAGISVLKGHVLIDNSLLDGETIPDGWIWQDIGNYYGAGAQSLNWRENQFDLMLKSGNEIGSTVNLSGTFPTYVSGLQLSSYLKAAPAGSGDGSYIYLPLFGERENIRGTIPVGQNDFKISGALPDPSRQFAISLEAALKKTTLQEVDKGYPSRQQVKKLNTDTNLFNIESPALDSINYWFLQKSINLYGEALIKTLAVKSGGDGSTQDGVKVVQSFWKDKGLDEYDLGMIDGSGLSPQNRITTTDLVTVLAYARKQPWFNSYFAGFPVYNGIKMKSGSISGVLSYTGIIKGKTGEYAFAFIINNYNGSGTATKKKMWNLLDILK